MSKNRSPRTLVFSALFLALALVLPFVTGQIPQIGSMLLPMHIPVLLCGFVCGPVWGILVGAIAPVLRSVLFGMPPMIPTAAAMAFELAAYGFLCGLLHGRMPQKKFSVFMELILAMLGGRLAWGLACWAIYSLMGSAFSFGIFVSGAFAGAWPGMILQVLIIPPLVKALETIRGK